MANNYLWQISDPSIVNPESAYYSAEDNAIFVSNVVGGELTKDGQGWISKISAEGELVAAKWVEGLNAPHGMRADRGKLWVADIDELVVIDIQSATVVSRIPIPGSVFLNDVAISDYDKVFVSDILSNRIYLVDRGQVTTFAEGPEMQSPNGLFTSGNNLFVAAWGNITDPDTFATDVPGNVFKLNITSGQKQQVTKVPLGNLDGIEQDLKGNLVVTDYSSGQLIVVNPTTGEQEQLISGLDAAADIGFIPAKNIVLIPSLSQNTITAYQYNPTLSQGEQKPEFLKFWEDIELAKQQFDLIKKDIEEAILDKVGVFVDDIQSRISALIPGQDDYPQAALSKAKTTSIFSDELTHQSRVDNSQQLGISFGDINESMIGVSQGGHLYAPFLFTDGTLDQILESSPSINNHLSVSSAHIGAWDGLDRMKLLENNAWNFENLPYGGNLNFNDIVIQANPFS